MTVQARLPQNALGMKPLRLELTVNSSVTRFAAPPIDVGGKIVIARRDSRRLHPWTSTNRRQILGAAVNNTPESETPDPSRMLFPFFGARTLSSALQERAAAQ